MGERGLNSKGLGGSRKFRGWGGGFDGGLGVFRGVLRV